MIQLRHASLNRFAQRFAVGSVLIAVIGAIPLSAQQMNHRVGITAPTPTPRGKSSGRLAARDVAPNNWLKGAIIGTGVGAALGYFLAAFGREDVHWPVFSARRSSEVLSAQ